MAFSRLVETPLETTNFEGTTRPNEPRWFLGTKNKDNNILNYEYRAHPLIMSAYIAFAEHRPLVLSPDAIWITILQGLASHVNLNPEVYRDLLVSHLGKETITVSVGDSTPWPVVFEQFCEKLSKGQKENALSEWAIPSFSTTGVVERSAFQVTFMEVLKTFKNFEVVCICGIPKIELTGTVQDWKDIENRIEKLDQVGWWAKSLKPICRKFVEASEGHIDLDHWAEIIKKEQTYGSELLDGWLVRLIPYVHEGKIRNSLFEASVDDESHTRGIYPSSLSKGISVVPFEFAHLVEGTRRTKEFMAGLAGIEQHGEDGALEARLGWAIRSKCVLTTVLDELERRNLMDNREKVDPRSGSDQISWEVLLIHERCNGANMCTKSGHPCGRLHPYDEQPVTRYVYPMDGDGPVWATKPSKEWKCYCAARHPELGYMTTYRAIGELDGKRFGMRFDRDGDNKVVFFDIHDGPDDKKRRRIEIADKDLGTLIQEAISRD